MTSYMLRAATHIRFVLTWTGAHELGLSPEVPSPQLSSCVTMSKSLSHSVLDFLNSKMETTVDSVASCYGKLKELIYSALRIVMAHTFATTCLAANRFIKSAAD